MKVNEIKRAGGTAKGNATGISHNALLEQGILGRKESDSTFFFLSIFSGRIFLVTADCHTQLVVIAIFETNWHTADNHAAGNRRTVRPVFSGRKIVSQFNSHRRKAFQLPDPIVSRMIALHKELEAAAREGSNIDGWRPLRLDSKGWVVAGKNIDGDYQVRQFYPTGGWKKASDYLELQSELRRIIFSDLTPEQLDAYKSATGDDPEHVTDDAS